LTDITNKFIKHRPFINNMTQVINTKDISRIKKEFETFEAKREEIIKKSRDALKASKRAISCLHSKNIKEADKLLKQAKSTILALNKTAKSPKLVTIGALYAAKEEYAEAVSYREFIKNSKLIPKSNIKEIDNEDYLKGICDLTGELGRRAVVCTINKEFKEVYKIREFVDSIHTILLSFSLRNSELRKKYDSIKWNLKKIEDIVYDIKTKKLDNKK